MAEIDQSTASNPDLALLQDEQQQAMGTRDAASAKLADDSASFDPEGATGPQPQFTEPTPQDHFNDVMKQAPLLMALGALGGVFTKQHGMTMLASTNAMMKGVVQGNADAYKDAREKYDEQYQQYRDKSKTWMDVYKAYSAAYKGRIDADVKAVQGANAAVGVIDRETRLTKSQIAQTALVSAKIDQSHATVTHMSNEDVVALIRAENDKVKAAAAATNAGASATRAGTSVAAEARKKETAAAGGGATDEDTKQTVALGNEILKQLESGDTGTFGGAGVGGMLSRGKEYVDTKLVNGKDAARPASTLATKANLFTEKMTAALKVKGQRMDAGDRIIIRDAIDIIKNKGVSDPIAADKIREALRIIQKQSGTPEQGKLPIMTPDEAKKAPKGTRFQGTNGQPYTVQ